MKLGISDEALRRIAGKRTSTSVNETWKKLDKIIEVLGEKDTLEYFIKAMDDSEVNEMLDFIATNYEIDLKEYNEDEFER